MLRFCLPTASPARTVSALLIACGIFLSLPGCAGVTPETPQETPEEKPDDKPGETPETPDTPEQPDTPVYFSGGDGSADNPYQIASKADFVSFVTNCNDPAVRDDFIGKAYLQTADIDMGGDALGPVGNASAAFPGTYDGGGHPIKNYSAGSALFPHTQGARLMNIVLQPGQPLSFDTPDSGALVGLMDDGLVDGCRFSGKVTSDSSAGSRPDRFPTARSKGRSNPRLRKRWTVRRTAPQRAASSAASTPDPWSVAPSPAA